MLELEVIPERSVGCEQWEFILGMHFSQAVAIIQSQVGIIKGAQVLYSDQTPLLVDLEINLSQDGTRLIFDPVSQRLKTIEIYNMKLISLKYGGNVFNSPEVIPSIEQIEYCFGATHPGVYDKERHVFQLNFRGLSFLFPVDSKFKPGFTNGLGSLQFPNGTSPVVARTCIYAGVQASDCRAPPMPVSCFNSLLYLDKAEVLKDKTKTWMLRLHLYTEDALSNPEPKRIQLTREIRLGDTCQDVVTAIGSPSRIFYKSEDKMKIHSPNPQRKNPRRSDYFCNFFTLGIDVLFDAASHCAKKFILHTNYPGHYNFNTYHRCEFSIDMDCLTKSMTTSRNSSNKKQQGLLSTDSMSLTNISAYTKWKEISYLVKRQDRPVVLNRSTSTNTVNPFGSTFCYPINDLIFEIMSNQHIASLTIYSPDRRLEAA